MNHHLCIYKSISQWKKSIRSRNMLFSRDPFEYMNCTVKNLLVLLVKINLVVAAVWSCCCCCLDSKKLYVWITERRCVTSRHFSMWTKNFRFPVYLNFNTLNVIVFCIKTTCYSHDCDIYRENLCCVLFVSYIILLITKWKYRFFFFSDFQLKKIMAI